MQITLSKWEKIIIPVAGILITAFVAIVSNLFGYYVTLRSLEKGPYLQNILTDKEQISSAASEYYSTAAAAFYAEAELSDADAKHFDKNSPYYIAISESEDKHYKDFLSASTKLAWQVPPEYRQQVLDIENLWDRLNDDDQKDFASKEKIWFDQIWKIRDNLINQVRYTNASNPNWK